MKRFFLLLFPLSLLPFAPRILAAERGQDVPDIEVPEDPGPARARDKEEAKEVPIEHRRLLEEVGTWSAEIKLFLSPGMPPVTSQGREVNRMIGDSWLVSDFTSTSMGETLVGHGQVGFDVERGVAVGTWIDSESAKLQLMEGTYDLDRRERTLFYKGPDGQGEEARFKAVGRVLEADHRIFDVFLLGDGREETPIMHIDYRLVSR